MPFTPHESNTSVTANNPLHIRGLDYVEFYVGNPRQAAHFYRTTFGLQPASVAGLDTGLRDRSSIQVENGDVRFVFTGAVSADGPVAQTVTTHGDTVKDIAFAVENVEHAFHYAVSRGARPLQEPTVLRVGDRQMIRASIGAFGDVVHSLVQRDEGDWFLPSFQQVSQRASPARQYVTAVDHLAVSLGYGQLHEQVEFYKHVLGFHESHEEYVRTDYSSMDSRVVQSPEGQIKLPLLEPVAGKRRSQIEEYLEYHGGPGVQHAALLSEDIIRTVADLRLGGVEFVSTPRSYYEMLTNRIGDVEEDVSALRDLNILVDRDAWGYLMQIFSKPLQSRPTFFLEVIQRKGARGFGSGNIKALFEAVEREQAGRGNL